MHDNLHSAPDSFPIPKFWEPNFWEATVQIALADYCRPGGVAFDVGANAGGLSLVMSRRVGPRGIVCAFEASPRIIGKTHYNLVNAGCSNVTLFHRAVFHTSHQYVRIFPGTHLNDSIYNDYDVDDGARYEVETIALDDFVSETGLQPDVIKMDIEGAEFDALKGASQILEKARPILMLEQSPHDMRCHALLTDADYLAIDLATYRPVITAESFPDGVEIANVLFVPKEHASDDPYVNSGAPEEVAKLKPEDFTWDDDRCLLLTENLRLPAGRYICNADFSALGQDNEIFAGIMSNRGPLIRVHSYTQMIANNYRNWLFTLGTEAEISPYIDFLAGDDATLEWNGAVIQRYPGFDRMQRRVTF